jgi:heterodisulfide reductase subunit B
VELEDWNCCGSSSAHSVDYDLAFDLACRNLSLNLLKFAKDNVQRLNGLNFVTDYGCMLARPPAMRNEKNYHGLMEKFYPPWEPPRSNGPIPPAAAVLF